MNTETYQPIEISGVKYIPTDIITIQGCKKQNDKMKQACKELGAIHQRVKEINRGGFFSNAFIVSTVLVPESNVKKLNDIINDEVA